MHLIFILKPFCAQSYLYLLGGYKPLPPEPPIKLLNYCNLGLFYAHARRNDKALHVGGLHTSLHKVFAEHRPLRCPHR